MTSSNSGLNSTPSNDHLRLFIIFIMYRIARVQFKSYYLRSVECCHKCKICSVLFYFEGKIFEDANLRKLLFVTEKTRASNEIGFRKYLVAMTNIW